MDHQHVLALVEAVDGADLHAVHVLALDAGFGDDVGHCGSLRCVAGLEGSGTDRGAKDWGLSGRKNMPSWKLSAMRSDRKSVVVGKGVSVRVDLGGRRSIKKKKNKARR